MNVNGNQNNDIPHNRFLDNNVDDEDKIGLTRDDVSGVLLTEAPHNPTENSEGMTQMMFEDFEAPAMYLTYTGSLALFGTGRVSGIALDVGHGVTSAVAVYEGKNRYHPFHVPRLSPFCMREQHVCLLRLHYV